jgi:hypothetical protein
MYANKKIMTVKIQRAIFGIPSVLVYNKDRSYCREFSLDKTFRTVMGKSVKGYFKAKLEDDKLFVLEPIHGLNL